MPDDLWAGRYRRDRLLGRGAMGEVWAAHDVVLDRTVAIKSIAPELIEPADLERMSREARVAARIGHPNAVNVYDLVTVDGRPNLVMEYVDGTTLDDLIVAPGRLGPNEVARIGAAVADALAEAHRLGVVHRDIKPANILVTPRGTPKLADFGIARGVGDASVTATGATIGTPAYLAPEVVQGSPADSRSDIWALGVTLYAALEGASPFVLSRHDDPLVVLGRVLTAPVTPPSVAGPLGQIIATMLDRDPARRPSAERTAAMLRDALTVGGNETVDLTPASGTTRLPRDFQGMPYASFPPADRPAAGASDRGRPKSRRRYMLVAAAAVVLAVGGTAVGLTSSHDTPAPEAGGANPLTSGSSPSGTGSSALPSTSFPAVGAEPGQTYRGPGGVVVSGPTGWTRDTSQSSSLIADYLSPGTKDRHVGQFFRIGIGDENAASSIVATRVAAKTALFDTSRSRLKDVVIVRSAYVGFLGTKAVDIEYTGTNVEGLHRHGVERLWNAGGVEREIIVNADADKWSDSEQVFRQLVDSARVAD